MCVCVLLFVVEYQNEQVQMYNMYANQIKCLNVWILVLDRSIYAVASKYKFVALKSCVISAFKLDFARVGTHM
jgi:hypothetical protein